MPKATVICKECWTKMITTTSYHMHYIYKCPSCWHKVVEYTELTIKK